MIETTFWRAIDGPLTTQQWAPALGWHCPSGALLTDTTPIYTSLFARKQQKTNKQFYFCFCLPVFPCRVFFLAIQQLMAMRPVDCSMSGSWTIVDLVNPSLATQNTHMCHICTINIFSMDSPVPKAMQQPTVSTAKLPGRS